MAKPNSHLSSEQLAALLDGGLDNGGLDDGRLDDGRLGNPESDALENHLLHCRICMAAYADTIRMRDDWTRGSGLRTSEADLRELGYRQFPGAEERRVGEGQAAYRPAVEKSPTRPQARRDQRRWLVAAVVPLLMVGVGWFGLRGALNQVSVDPSFAMVSTAVHEASHHGMILPGSGTAAWAPATTFRAASQTRPDLNAALAALAVQHDDNAARLLRAEGLLATGRLDLARLLTENTRRELPNDTSWQQLAAVVAFRENNLSRAEILLRGVLVTEPDNIEAQFNLGLVLAASDQQIEARRIFFDVSQRADYPLAQKRAQGLMRSR